jgi:hypothetical protein
MSQSSKLFEPFKLGPLTLPNRLVMAPLTRNRAVPPGMVPSPLAVEYYAQRASAGLLITEASQVSQQGQGYQDTPGIYSKEQVAGWKKITDAVHAQGGRISIQLWHVGRISHTSLQPNGGAPVGPSAIRAKGKTSSTASSPISPNPARWSFRRFPESSRISGAVRPMRWKPVLTASRFMAPTVICSTSSRKTAPTSARINMADRSRTAQN